jgi:Fic family protein
VLKLKADHEKAINLVFGRRAHNASILLNHLFKNPIVYVRQVEDITGLSYKAANALVSDFIKNGILKEMTGQSRNRVFSFEKYLRLF